MPHDNFGFTGPTPDYNKLIAWILSFLPGITSTTSYEDYTQESNAPNVSGGVWNTIFDDGKGTDQSKVTEMCGLVQRGPEICLCGLAEHYQIKTVDVANPPRYNPPDPSPGPSPTPTPLPPQPSNPVGPMFAVGKYFPKRGDVSPVGSVYTDGVGNVYIKTGYSDPFGTHLWWELQ